MVGDGCWGCEMAYCCQRGHFSNKDFEKQQRREKLQIVSISLFLYYNLQVNITLYRTKYYIQDLYIYFLLSLFVYLWHFV